MTTRYALPLLGVLFLLIAPGCGGVSQSPKETMSSSGYAGAPAMDMASPEVMNRMAMVEEGGVAPPSAPMPGSPNDDLLNRQPASDTDRYLIKTASLLLEVKDPHAAVESARQIARAAKGFDMNLHETMDGLGRKSATLTIRVPTDQFDTALKQLDALGTRLDLAINTQDVTDQFVDTQATLRNLKATEARLLEHLTKSDKIESTLLIENELTRVRGQIEGYEGQLRNLARQIDYSTITITLQEEQKPGPIVPPEKFSTRGEVSVALRDLLVWGQGLWRGVIHLAIWAIVWIPALLVARFIWRKLTNPNRGGP